MRKWIWAFLLVVPLAVGGFVYANLQAKLQPRDGAGDAGASTEEESCCAECCLLDESK